MVSSMLPRALTAATLGVEDEKCRRQHTALSTSWIMATANSCVMRCLATTSGLLA
jgi:hypothetical protein